MDFRGERKATKTYQIHKGSWSDQILCAKARVIDMLKSSSERDMKNHILYYQHVEKKLKISPIWSLVMIRVLDNFIIPL